MKILCLDTNHPALIATLREAGLQCDEAYTETRAQVEAMIASYDALVIRSRFKIDRAFIDKAANLKCIARAGAGMENIDVAYAESKGIRCVHAPDGNRDAVGEQAAGMLIALMNNICTADRQVREGKWIREGNRGYELNGKTVGIIGYGNMGSAFAQRLKGFGVRILAYDKYKTNFGSAEVEEAKLERLFEEADVLSLHVPLTEETRYMIDEKFLEKFRKSIWLINTARGGCLCTADLVKQLERGKVRGACLDVLEYEDVSFEGLNAANLPEPFQYLIRSDKVILSPHVAGWTFESHEKIGRILAGKVVAVLRERGAGNS